MARKETSKMSRAVSQLEHIFNKMNADFFEGKLPTPIITVQSSPRSYGHSTNAKVWKKKDGETYELNIAAEVLNYPIEETLDTIGHEMVHLYCRENDIQECSRGGVYHNGKFKELAEKIGLECFKTEKYGWNTRPSDKMIQYALDNDWNEITLGRTTPIKFATNFTATNVHVATPTPEPKRPSSTRKYICPHCKQTIRATKDVNVICGNCMVKMEKC